MNGARHDPCPTVFVVDDDPAVLSSLQFALEVEGFQVLAFSNGEALLDYSTPVNRGCFVVDYQLGGIDGLALLAKLRAKGRQLPAILITTSQPDVMLRAAREGVPVIEKPLLCERLVGEVRRLIDDRPAANA